MRRERSEEGFGLVEVTVALGVVFVCLMGLVSTTVGAFRGVALARERQSATGIAEQVIEQVRGLRYADVAKGLSSTEPAYTSDTNIVNCNGVRYLRYCPPDARAEAIVSTAGLAAAAPLVPHRVTIGRPTYPTTFTRRVYVTRTVPAGQTGPHRVTVEIDWQEPGRGSRTSSVDTLVFAPVGCVDPVTHPFAGPCSPYYLGSGSIAQGRITIGGTLDGQNVEAHLRTVGTSQEAQIEQISSGRGSIVASELELAGPQGEQRSGGLTAVSAADDDPGTPPASYASVPLGSAMPNTLTGTFPSGSVLRTASTVVVTGGDSGSTTSATAAGAQQPCPLAPAPPAAEADARPCGFARARRGVTLDATLTSSLAGLPIGATTLARTEAPSSASHVFVDRNATTGQDGTLSVSGSRTIGRTDLGGLPAGALGPVLWEGYLVRLSGYQDSVSATAGPGAPAPSATVNAGTLRYWNGLGYTTLTVGSSPSSVTIPTVGATVVAPGRVLQVELSGTVATTGTSVGTAPAGNATEVRATAGSPLVASLRYRVVDGSTVVADLTIDADLGALSARSSYQAGSVAN